MLYCSVGVSQENVAEIGKKTIQVNGECSIEVEPTCIHYNVIISSLTEGDNKLNFVDKKNQFINYIEDQELLLIQENCWKRQVNSRWWKFDFTLREKRCLYTLEIQSLEELNGLMDFIRQLEVNDAYFQMISYGEAEEAEELLFNCAMNESKSNLKESLGYNEFKNYKVSEIEWMQEMNGFGDIVFIGGGGRKGMHSYVEGKRVIVEKLPWKEKVEVDVYKKHLAVELLVTYIEE